jgi:uncharacterized membrane protein YkoI
MFAGFVFASPAKIAGQFSKNQEIVMQKIVRSLLFAAAALFPAAALAQGLVMSPAPADEDVLVIQEPAMGVVPLGRGPLTEDDAVAIAMLNGMVTVEDVDSRMWDGNFEVEGEDGAGNDLEITIDGETGAVLEIDD